MTTKIVISFYTGGISCRISIRAGVWRGKWTVGQNSPLMTSKPAKNQRLVTYLHNTKYRSDCGRVMAAAVRNDSVHLQKFFPNLQCPNNDNAKKLIKQLAPVVMITRGRIPFYPVERPWNNQYRAYSTDVPTTDNTKYTTKYM